MGTDKTRTILLVEDEEVTLISVSHILGKFGYNVITAGSGETAIKIIASGNDVELVLMDVDLRGMGGPETAEKILKIKNMPIVFLTSHAEEEVVNRVAHITRYGYVIKNTGNSVLKSSIEMAFELFDAHKRIKEANDWVNQIAGLTNMVAWSINSDGLFTYVSDVVTQMSDYTPEDLIGQVYCYQLITNSNKEEIKAKALQMINSRQPFRNFEWPAVRKDGSSLWVNISGMPIVDEAGELKGYYGFCSDISERKNNEEQIKMLLHQKELLLKEVHHRVKNNMSAMISLLSIQADMQENEQAVKALEEAGRRMKSMGVLYDKLYLQDNFSEMFLDDYLIPLVEEVMKIFTSHCEINTFYNIEHIPLGIKKLSPLGIIVNEIVNNIMKYAFKGRSEGIIKISAVKNKNIISLEIEDNGIGLPENFDVKRDSGFGLDLVQMLALQIDGVLHIKSSNGVKILLEIEDDNVFPDFRVEKIPDDYSV